MAAKNDTKSTYRGYGGELNGARRTVLAEPDHVTITWRSTLGNCIGASIAAIFFSAGSVLVALAFIGCILEKRLLYVCVTGLLTFLIARGVIFSWRSLRYLMAILRKGDQLTFDAGTKTISRNGELVAGFDKVRSVCLQIRSNLSDPYPQVGAFPVCRIQMVMADEPIPYLVTEGCSLEPITRLAKHLAEMMGVPFTKDSPPGLAARLRRSMAASKKKKAS